jgi:hypothetical protein
VFYRRDHEANRRKSGVPFEKNGAIAKFFFIASGLTKFHAGFPRNAPCSPQFSAVETIRAALQARRHQEKHMSRKLIALTVALSMGCSGIALAQTSGGAPATQGTVGSGPNNMSGGSAGAVGNGTGSTGATSSTSGSMSDGSTSGTMSGGGDHSATGSTGTGTTATGGMGGSVGGGSGK